MLLRIIRRGTVSLVFLHHIFPFVLQRSSEGNKRETERNACFQYFYLPNKIYCIYYLQGRFAGIKLSKLARSVIADTMTTSAWTSAVILDRCLSWIRLRITLRRVAVENTRHNAGTQCVRVKCNRI